MNLLKDKQKIRFIDLFSGLGGFRVAIEQVCRQQNLESDCVFSCDIDRDRIGWTSDSRGRGKVRGDRGCCQIVFIGAIAMCPLPSST
jgi:hypothetical protein